ncbi:MAG: hypothetical protein RQ733_08450 [Methyloprofundus sp.]|nr:hypothetical protein [Methyloprofundus sp.]MDT8425991.1 hypothetical protein [Methyloprofundus sp.]
MMLLNSTDIALKQITTILTLLSSQAKTKQQQLFIDQRIGVHIRHVHDHFRSLFTGLESGIVDYNLRNRESSEELHLQTCLTEHDKIFVKLNTLDSSAGQIEIISEINCHATENLQMTSSIERELLYLINHTIHHAAIIKYIMDLGGVTCPHEIGLAPGTATYYRQLPSETERCVQ